MIPSTNIQSPILNLFSTKTKIPEIKFLNKSCAPKATATPNKLFFLLKLKSLKLNF